MIIELQIRASQFAAGFRERMRRELSCRVVEFDIGTEAFMATSFDMGNTVLRHGFQPSAVACVRGQHLLDEHHVSHRALQLVQTIHANVCAKNNLIAANAAACPTFQLHLDLVFEIAMDSCTWWSDLVFTFVGLDGLSSDTAFVQAFTAQMTPSRQPLPFAQLLSALPGIGNPIIINAQIVLSQGNQTIAIRGETWDPIALYEGRDTMRGLAYWQTFLNNSFVEHLSAGGEARDWSIFMEKDFIVAPLRDALESSLLDSSDLRLHGSVSASWENHGGTPRINVDFNADAISACRCFTKKIDVNADNHLSIDLSVPKTKPNVMRQDAYIDVDPNGWDALCCSITGALFWPLVGAELLADEQIDWWLYPLGIGLWGLNPFILFGAAMWKALSPEGSIKPKGGLTKDPDDDSHWIQEAPSPMQPTDFGTPTLNHAAAVDDAQLLQASGVLLSGGLKVAMAQSTGVLDTLEMQPFAYHITGGCSQMRAAQTAFISCSNTPERIPVEICDVRVLDDPLGVFSRLNPPEWAHNSPTIRYSVGWVPPEYFEHPYPCRLLIVTRSGVRLVTLGVLADRTAADDKRLFGELVGAISECKAISDSFWSRAGRLRPEWIPDPPQDARTRHLWQIRVAGLNPGEQVSVTGAQNRRVGLATADGGGIVLITAMTTPAGGARELTVTRIPRAVRDVALNGRAVATRGQKIVEEEDIRQLARRFLAASRRGVQRPFGANLRRGIVVRQTALVERSRLWFPSVVRRAELFTRGRAQMLTVVTDDRLVEFNLRDGARPVCVNAYRVEGLRGHIRQGDRVLAYGARGFVRLGLRAQAAMESRPCTERRDVQAAIGLRGGMAALECGSVRLYDESLCHIGGQLEGDRVTSLLRLDGFLIVGSANGFDVYTAQVAAPELLARVELAGARSVHGVPGMGGGRFAYVAQRKGGTLFDLSEARQPREVMQLADENAWFIDGSHQGTTLVVPSADRTQVIIYDASNTVTL